VLSSIGGAAIALNDRAEYEDGGLWIAATGDVLNGDAGTVLCFAGQIMHGGFPVRRRRHSVDYDRLLLRGHQCVWP